MAEDHYLGNPLLKKAYVPQDLTEEQVFELTRCSLDPVYFAKNYVKIVTLDHGLQPFKLFPFQERMISSFNNNRFNILLTPRQVGKCFNINTKVRIKNKLTNEIFEVTIGELYEKAKNSKEVDLS